MFGMNKIDYNAKMKEIINSLNTKPRLLLHSCCGPCSSSVLDRIKNYFDITVIYYNPNIYPKEEYIHRKEEQIRLLKELNINFMDCDYNQDDFFKEIKGLEDEKEGGARCNKCFYLRLNKVAQIAQNNGYEYFGTTLTVSPHKNSENINLIGKNLQEKYKINYLFADFKKEDGYLNSIKLAKKYNLYRQDYCGCIFSLEEKKKRIWKKFLKGLVLFLVLLQLLFVR